MSIDRDDDAPEHKRRVLEHDEFRAGDEHDAQLVAGLETRLGQSRSHPAHLTVNPFERELLDAEDQRGFRGGILRPAEQVRCDIRHKSAPSWSRSWPSVPRIVEHVTFNWRGGQLK